MSIIPKQFNRFAEKFAQLTSGMIFVTFVLSISWICTSFFQIHSVSVHRSYFSPLKSFFIVCTEQRLLTPQITKTNHTTKKCIAFQFPLIAFAKFILLIAAKHYDHGRYHPHHINFLLFRSYGNDGLCWHSRFHLQCIVVSVSDLFAKIDVLYCSACSAAVLFHRI